MECPKLGDFGFQRLCADFALLFLDHSRNRQHSDVIFLPEYLSGLDDERGGQVTDGASAIEAEQLILLILRFDDAVGDDQQAITVLQSSS